MKVLIIWGLILAVFAVNQALQCPNDWVRFEGSCYVFLDEVVPWTSARAFCNLLSAKMLEVGSKTENDFIVGQIHSRGLSSVWMGLTDLVREGRWQWNSNRETPEYTNFAPGSQDDSHLHENGQDCVQIYSNGLWDDLWCENVYTIPDKPSPVCELDASENLIG